MARGILILLFFVAACATPAGPTDPDGNSGGTANGDGPAERVFGTITYYNQPVDITLPSEAVHGEPFTLSILTYGDGCLEQGETDVQLEARRAEIRPYDYNTTPGRPCEDIVRAFEHQATVTFAEVGEVEIVFYGQRVSEDGVTNTSVTRTLTVK